jgi:hypothetical protein
MRTSQNLRRPNWRQRSGKFFKATYRAYPSSLTLHHGHRGAGVIPCIPGSSSAIRRASSPFHSCRRSIWTSYPRRCQTVSIFWLDFYAGVPHGDPIASWRIGPLRTGVFSCVFTTTDHGWVRIQALTEANQNRWDELNVTSAYL